MQDLAPVIVVIIALAAGAVVAFGRRKAPCAVRPRVER